MQSIIPKNAPAYADNLSIQYAQNQASEENFKEVLEKG